MSLFNIISFNRNTYIPMMLQWHLSHHYSYFLEDLDNTSLQLILFFQLMGSTYSYKYFWAMGTSGSLRELNLMKMSDVPSTYISDIWLFPLLKQACVHCPDGTFFYLNQFFMNHFIHFWKKAFTIFIPIMFHLIQNNQLMKVLYLPKNLILQSCLLIEQSLLSLVQNNQPLSLSWLHLCFGCIMMNPCFIHRYEATQNQFHFS